MKRIIFSILASGLCVSAMAIPAKPGFVEYRQPDGSVVNIRMVGDEHGHMAYSESGKLLVEVDGYLEYASFDTKGFPKASGIKVSDNYEWQTLGLTDLQPQEKLEKWAYMVNSNRTARIEKMYANSARTQAFTRSEDSDDIDASRLVPLNFGRWDVTFPVMGEQKGLVILVSYQDIDFKYGDFDYFDRMLNEEGFSDFGSLGSARDWFIFNSNGRFIPDFDVYGPVVLPNDREYYGGNDDYGNDKRAEEMAIDACKLLDEEVDFSEYDRDGDGVIDNVFIFYAGNGEHDSNIANAVWPHAYDISDVFPNVEFIFDGVKLDHYACACEYPSGYKRPDGICTFVHEFSHVMGLPDLYETTYSGGFTPGGWSVMDHGPYNNDRLTPPNYSSYEKCALGWLDFLPFSEGRMELTDLSSTNVAYALPTDNKNEFYFFENRQLLGNDAFIPGHGMLVWHVDYKEDIWEYNEVNNLMSHQYVDLIEADNIKSKTTRDGDAFPGTKNVTSFGYDTTPQLASWSKKRLAFDLDNIEESEDGIISFYAIAADQNDPNDVIDIEGTNSKENIYYDLTGRRVVNPGKGIYIVNGKKIIL